MSYDEIIAELTRLNPEAKLADGLEAALVGHAVVDGRALALYSAAKVCAILRERDGMDEDEAQEFFEFNIAGAYIGPNTPVFHYFRWDRDYDPENHEESQ